MQIFQPVHFELRKHFERWFSKTDFYNKLYFHDLAFSSVYGPKLSPRMRDMTFWFCCLGFYGKYFSQFLKTYRSNFVFVDIGANAGLYSLIAVQNQNCMHSHCFEPDPITSMFLAKNIELNCTRNISIHRCAIADEKGQKQVSVNQFHSGSLSLNAPLPPVEHGNVIPIDCVNASDLPQIIPQREQELIIKIDVEGYEFVVIGELLKCEFAKHIGHIYFEAGGSKENLKTSIDLLTKAGFASLYHSNFFGHKNIHMVRSRKAKPL